MCVRTVSPRPFQRRLARLAEVICLGVNLHRGRRVIGETGGNSSTFCFGNSGTETIWDIRLLFTCVQTLVIWLYSPCKNIWKCQHQVVEIRLRKKWLQMLQSNPSPDARSIVTAARVNCNILKNNIIISTAIKKRKITIWTDYLFPDGFMRPKKIQVYPSTLLGGSWACQFSLS